MVRIGAGFAVFAVVLVFICAGSTFGTIAGCLGPPDSWSAWPEDTSELWSLELSRHAAPVAAVEPIQAATAYGKLPLSFVENRGQLDRAVRYVIRGPRASAFFTDSGVTFDLRARIPKGLRRRSENRRDSIGLAGSDVDEQPTARKRAVLRMTFADADPQCRV